jgi:hypothetical protein
VADTLKGLPSDGDDLDVLRFSSEAKADKKVTQRVPLFYIDDEVYTVPRYPDPTVGLKYLKILHEESEGEANYYLLIEMLGQEGYDALMEYGEAGKLTTEQFDAVIAKALRIAGRQDESPKGNRRNGQSWRRR